MVRDRWIGELHKLGVEIVPNLRLFGADADSVYFQHTASLGSVVFDQIDTLVLAFAHQSENALANALEIEGFETVAIGDCLSPRTVEEAIYEAMVTSSTL